MSLKDTLVWLFARNTKPGHRYLHGAEEQAERAERARIVSEACRRVQSKYQPGPMEIQFQDGEHTVKVRSGYSFDHGVPTTEILIIPRGNATGSHWHIVIDENGNELMHAWRQK